MTWCFIVLISKVFMLYFELKFDFLVVPIHLILHIFPARVKILLVLVLVPAVSNCLLIWVQDNLLKKSQFSEDEKELLYSGFFESEDLFDESASHDDDV